MKESEQLKVSSPTTWRQRICVWYKMSFFLKNSRCQICQDIRGWVVQKSMLLCTIGRWFPILITMIFSSISFRTTGMGLPLIGIWVLSATKLDPRNICLKHFWGNINTTWTWLPPGYNYKIKLKESMKHLKNMHKDDVKWLRVFDLHCQTQNYLTYSWAFFRVCTLKRWSTIYPPTLLTLWILENTSKTDWNPGKLLALLINRQKKEGEASAVMTNVYPKFQAHMAPMPYYSYPYIAAAQY